MNKKLVLYHGGCQDGHAAAFLAWRKFGEEADYVPVLYGTEPPDVSGRAVYVLDFSYPKPAMEKMIADSTYFVALDHHDTSKQMFAELAAIHSPKAHIVHGGVGDH